ncbi:Dyp-type peroxidase family [Corynebacterium mustelae]|uniref:Dyp-type peroxidase family n=1 Tax=Corynebacterium mustelae TaxID=571915 RepID=A0A0G3H2I0_9CORY|nr:Dyp-type peroxidase [Corynebacterium mustelae]AKK05302.1 Dyp-type peroxidase family [Corynebacterium mustelae]
MTHQTGITALGTTDHLYLELDVASGTNPKDAVGQLAAAINLPTTVGANVVVGVRPELWADVAANEFVPHDVHGFNEPIQGIDSYEMPATQHDAWIWVASFSRSQSFDVAKHIMAQLSGCFTVADETVGWAYEINRDLTGFEDGTENPGALEAPGIVGVPAGQPGAGSSVVLFQKWGHRVKEWDDLSVDKQQAVIGRTKHDSVELPEESMPESSHVSRSVVEVDGEEQDVFRRNTSYGELTNHGTTFVGFSFQQWRLEQMLRQMAGADGGPRDALTYFTDALTGAWYVCPSVAGLLAVAQPFVEEED